MGRRLPPPWDRERRGAKGCKEWPASCQDSSVDHEIFRLDVRTKSRKNLCEFPAKLNSIWFSGYGEPNPAPCLILKEFYYQESGKTVWDVIIARYSPGQ